MVWSLKVRNLTIEDIRQALYKQGYMTAGGKPYSTATIHRDIEAMVEWWRGEVFKDTEMWFNEQLAKLVELEKAAWAEKDYKLVLSIIAEQSKMMGVHAPVKYMDVTPEQKVKQLLIDGKVTQRDVIEELGDDLAHQLFEQAGITVLPK